MRLIDGDALKEKLPNTYRNGFENCRECRLLEREEVNAYIDRMPTVDAVPVVRCGECAYWTANNAEEGDCSGVCHNGNSPAGTTDMTWFCPEGERMDG